MADLDGDETEGDKSMSKPRSLDGVVTTALGKTDFLPDGSFVTTQWLTLFMIPIVPLASFRVIKSKRYPEHTRICERTPLDAKQIGLIYLFIVFCAGWLLFVPVLLGEYLLNAPGWVFMTALLLGLPVPAILPWLVRRNARSKARSWTMLVRGPTRRPARVTAERRNQTPQRRVRRVRSSRPREGAPGFKPRTFLPHEVPRIAPQPRP